MSEAMKRSQKQEKRVAKTMGGWVNPGSGNTWSKKNDVRSPGWLSECKCKLSPTAKSITLNADDLEDLRVHAYQDGLNPALHFELRGRDYVVVLREDFDELRGDGDGGSALSS